MLNIKLYRFKFLFIKLPQIRIYNLSIVREKRKEKLIFGEIINYATKCNLLSKSPPFIFYYYFFKLLFQLHRLQYQNTLRKRIL